MKRSKDNPDALSAEYPRLSDANVREIRRLYAQGWSADRITTYMQRKYERNELTTRTGDRVSIDPITKGMILSVIRRTSYTRVK